MTIPIARIGDIIIIQGVKPQEPQAWQEIVTGAEFVGDQWEYSYKTGKTTQNNVLGVFSVSRQYFSTN